MAFFTAQNHYKVALFSHHVPYNSDYCQYPQKCMVSCCSAIHETCIETHTYQTNCLGSIINDSVTECDSPVLQQPTFVFDTQKRTLIMYSESNDLLGRRSSRRLGRCRVRQFLSKSKRSCIRRGAVRTDDTGQ